MSAEIEKILKRYERAKTSFINYESILREAYTYALPDKGYFDTLTNGRRTTRIYDSTAILGVGTYADKVQQNLVPAWRKWFMLTAGSEIPEEQHKEVQPQLDEITEIIYDHINHSNFSTKINEALQDTAISTGILTCEEGDGVESSLRFGAESVEDVVFEPDTTGLIENTFKKFKLRIAEIENVIPDAKLTDKQKMKLAKDPLAECWLLETIIKNKEKKYEHKVIDLDEKVSIFEATDDTNPYIIFRERVSSKGTYGMGRVIQLIYDIKVLNKIAEMDLKNAGIAISGVYTAVDDGVVNPYTITLQAGTVIPVNSNNNANPSLRPLERSGDYNIAQLKMEQKQELITKVLFGMPLGSVTRTPVRTATEVQVRDDETFEMTTAAFSRFQTELLERTIKRVVDVLQKAGKIPPITVDGKLITIKFTSPLAKQQDREDVRVITDYAQIMAATGIPLESMGVKIKFEEVPVYVAENLGFPAKLIRTEEEEMVYTQKQQQAMAAQIEMEQQA